MDNIQTGKLIAALRKQRGLTQQQLADELCLSNKTISKWELGLGSPDVGNLPPLADALGVTVDELLRGEVNESQSSARDAESKAEARKKEWAIILLAASIGAVLGILAYNFGWLG